MKPVNQTRFGGPDVPPDEQGNCVAACLASIFEVGLEDVPDFRSGEHWWPMLGEWLASRGLAAVYVHANENGKGFGTALLPDDAFYMLGVKSRTLPGCDHAVVALGYQVVHDPNPNTEKLDWNGYHHLDAVYFVLKNPAFQ